MVSTFMARLSAILLTLVIGLISVGVAASTESSALAVTSRVEARQQPTLVPTPTFVATPEDTALPEGGAGPHLDTDPFIRTELFFGSERLGKPEVSEAEFKQFLDEEITPRFPDGLTLLTGFGQFREASGETVQETSFVLILLYPREAARDSSARIEEIRRLYIEQFEQESVLRVDDPRPVRVSF